MSGPESERRRRPEARRLVSLGGLLTDLVVRVDAVPARGEDALASGLSRTVGGSFATMAAAARLGMPVALAGVLGDDAAGDAGRAALASEGIEMELPDPRPGTSGLCLVMVDPGGERTMVTAPGVESRLTVDDLAAIRLRPGDIVYLSGYELLYPHGPELVDWIAGVRPARLVFDPGPLVATIPPELLDPVLAATAWLSLNAAEAAHLGVEPKAPRRVRSSARRRGATVRDGMGCVVRHGAAGCVVREPGGEAVTVPGFAARAVDTTGAGDTHVGAFVAALSRGLDPVEAARWGNAAAAHVVASTGQVSPPRPDQLEAILGDGGI